LRFSAFSDATGFVWVSNFNGDESLRLEVIDTVNMFFASSSSIKNDSVVLDSIDDVPKFINDLESKCRILGLSTYESSGGKTILNYEYQEGKYQEVTLRVGLLSEPIVNDRLVYRLILADYLINLIDTPVYVAWAVIIAFVLAVIFLIMLLCGAGHKNGVEGVYLNRFHRIPFDLYLVINGAVAVWSIDIFFDLLGYSVEYDIILYCVFLFSWIVIALALLVTLSARLKSNDWYKRTVIFSVVKLVWKCTRFCAVGLVKLISKIPLYYKSLLLLFGVFFADSFFVLICFNKHRGDYLAIFRFFEVLLISSAVIYLVLGFRKLQKGCQRIADGDLDYKINTEHMISDLRSHGQTLNRIGEGLSLAVEKSTKSERMKAELITNVSHDIKTPLTSIINYVDLIKREGLESENINEYINVLDRQSARLKKLTEDLVEASKAATGNITVNCEPMDINLFLGQVMGEYEERMSGCNLEIVSDITEGELTVNADGRCLWRVFDNLLNNICKYSQPDTRVYLSAKEKDGKAVISLKNISKEPLNIDPTEITERFVRGDESRNTEGSGLGLSIAKSLVELQGGVFKIEIDGDLFKVVITI